MTLINYSVLAFFESLGDQHHRKPYAYGSVIPVIAEINQPPPFQFIAPSGSALDSIEVINLKTGATVEKLIEFENAGLVKTVSSFGDVFKYPSKLKLSGDLFGVGHYYLKVTANNGLFVRYSDVFCMDYLQDDLIKLTFCHSENLEFTNGLIDYSNYFQYFLYFAAEIGKPKYEYEEETAKRDGYNYPLKQISYKSHLFEAFLNEEIIDVLRLVRLHDFVKIEKGGKVYDIDEIIITPEWLEQGDVARVEFEFRTDTVVIVNARALTNATCEIPAGGCFETDYTAASTIVLNSAEWNGFYYIDQSTGVQTSLLNGSFVVREFGSTSKLFEHDNGVYTLTGVNEGDIIFDSNYGRYYYGGSGDLLTASSFIKEDTFAKGFAIPTSIVEVWVKLSSGEERLIEVGTAETYNGDGIPYLQPNGAAQIQARHSGGNCGVYYVSDWVDFQTVCTFEIQGTYRNFQTAINAGVQDDEYFLLEQVNPYGLPALIVMQVNPSETYDNDTDARSALGNDTCYAVSASNPYGLPKGTIRALVLTASTFENDAAAQVGGFGDGEIYIWSGGGGFTNLFKQSNIGEVEGN